MPTNWASFPVEFRGGLISNLSPLQQGINAVGSATILQNFEPSKEGGYKKVLGYEKFMDTEIPGTGVVLGIAVLEPQKAIAARQNLSGPTEYYLGNGTTWSSLGAASSLGGKIQSTSFNFNGVEKVFFVDGVNSPAVYEGATQTLSFPSGYPSDVVGANCVEIFKNHVFVAKGHTVAFSAPLNETDFSIANGGGVLSLRDEVVCLKVFRNQLILFCRESIHTLSGSDVSTFQVQPITEDIGCNGRDTVQEVGGDIMFFAPDGTRLLSATDRIGDFGLNLASAPIEEDVKTYSSTVGTLTSLVLRNKAQYRVFRYSVSEAPSNATGLIATKFADQGAGNMQWATTKGFKVYCADSRYVDGQEVVLFANDSGFVYTMETGSSLDGDPIEAIYESPFMPLDDPQTRKTLYKCSLYVDASGSFSVDLNMLYDIFKVKNYNEGVVAPTIRLESTSGGSFVYGSTETVYGSATYGSVLDKIYNTPLVGSGNTFAFKISSNDTNPSFSLDAAVFEYTTSDRR